MLAVRELFSGLFASAVSHRGEAPIPLPVTLPVADNDAETYQRFGSTEGLTFMIEYVDGQGHFSRRRITVWNISAGSGGTPLLCGRCHERNADRSFRIDRIKTIIDLDGEIHNNVADYLETYLGLQRELAQMANDKTRAKDEHWHRMRLAARPFAIILAGLSLSDGQKHPAEIDAAAEFCEMFCERARLEPTSTTGEAFARYIKNMRPDTDTMIECIDELLATNSGQIIDFLRACKDVILADGRLHPAELQMIDDISMHLTGLHMVVRSDA